jgi:hypothetical protein
MKKLVLIPFAITATQGMEQVPFIEGERHYYSLDQELRSADWRWSQGRLEVQAQSKPGSLLWIQSAQNQRLLRVQ